MDEFKLEAKVTFHGEVLHLNKTFTQFDLADFMPSRGPVDPHDYAEIMQRRERRMRFVDMIASNFAETLTTGLFKLGEKR